MQTAHKLTWLSPEDYLALEELAETKSEYVDGQILAMAGTSRAHAGIVRELLVALATRLRGGPCQVYANDVKVRVEAANAFYYPDLVIACDPSDGDTHVVHRPRAIVEVLSPSTETLDRREKRINYQKIESIQEIVLVSQDQRRVDLYRRDPDGWTVETVEESGSVRLHALDVTVALEEIYGG